MYYFFCFLFNLTVSIHENNSRISKFFYLLCHLPFYSKYLKSLHPPKNYFWFLYSLMKWPIRWTLKNVVDKVWKFRYFLDQYRNSCFSVLIHRLKRRYLCARDNYNVVCVIKVQYCNPVHCCIAHVGMIFIENHLWKV